MNRKAETVIQVSKQCLTRLLPYITEPVTVDFVASYLVTGEIPGHAWKLPIRVSLVDPHSLARQLLVHLSSLAMFGRAKSASGRERAMRAELCARHTCYDIRTWLIDNT